MTGILQVIDVVMILENCPITILLVYITIQYSIIVIIVYFSMIISVIEHCCIIQNSNQGLMLDAWCIIFTTGLTPKNLIPNRPFDFLASSSSDPLRSPAARTAASAPCCSQLVKRHHGVRTHATQTLALYL